MPPSRKSKPSQEKNCERRPGLNHLGLGITTALAVATPLIPSEAVAETGAGLFLIMLWLLLLLGWAAAGLLRGQLAIRADGVLAAIVVFAALVATSGWIMAWNGNPRATINSVWQWIAFAVIFFLARQWIVLPVTQRAFCAVMVGLAVALSGLGYYQFFVSMPETRARYSEDPVGTMQQANVGDPNDPQIAELFRNRVMSIEPIATFALTNSFAAFLTPWLVLCAGIAVSTAWRREPHAWRSMVGPSLALVLIGGCFFLTKSRASWAAAVCGCALLMYYGRRGAEPFSWRLPVAVALGVVLLLLGAVMVGGLDAEVLSEAPKSLVYRFEYWQATAAMIRDYPLWGVGVGNFQDYYTAYKLPQASETVADPHNFLLEIWATSGTLALLAFLAIGLAAARKLRTAAILPIESTPTPTALDEPPSPHETAARTAVYLGAAVGALIAYPIGLAAQFLPDLTFLAVGLPLGAVSVYLLDSWVRRGELSLQVLVVAIAVFLINLLAAGGIGFAAVATSLWLLLALMLNRQNLRQHVFFLRPSVRGVVCVAAVGLIAACYMTAYRPTLQGTALASEAAAAAVLGRSKEAVNLCQAAAQADPLSPEPWKQLALLALEPWLAGDASASLEFEQAAHEALRRDGRSFALWKTIGDWRMEAYRVGSEPVELQKALAAYEKAVTLYPNNARLRAEWAWNLSVAGDAKRAAAEADRALRLDQSHAHKNQKLANFVAPTGAEADNLEHLAKKLRKLERTGSSLAP